MDDSAGDPASEQHGSRGSWERTNRREIQSTNPAACPRTEHTACKPSHLPEPWAQGSSHKLPERREKRKKGQKLERLDLKHHLLYVPWFFLISHWRGYTRPKTRSMWEPTTTTAHQKTHPQDDSCMGGTELEWPQRRSYRTSEATTTLRGGSGSWLRAWEMICVKPSICHGTVARTLPAYNQRDKPERPFWWQGLDLPQLEQGWVHGAGHEQVQLLPKGPWMLQTSQETSSVQTANSNRKDSAWGSRPVPWKRCSSQVELYTVRENNRTGGVWMSRWDRGLASEWRDPAPNSPFTAQPKEDLGSVSHRVGQLRVRETSDIILLVTLPSTSHAERENQPSSINKMAKGLDKPTLLVSGQASQSHTEEKPNAGTA